VTSPGPDVSTARPVADPFVPWPEEDARRYREVGRWRDRTLGQELADAAGRWGDRVAVAEPDRSLTYAELDDTSDRLAAGLLGLGLEPGDPLVFQLANTAEAVLAFYATVKAGLVPVCALPMHREREIDQLVERTGARAHLVQGGFAAADLVAFGRETAARHPSLAHLLVAGPGGGGPEPSLAELIERGDRATARDRLSRLDIDPAGVALLQLSGGTTGVPKLIPRTHNDYACNARAWAGHWGWDESTATLHVLPVIHNAGLLAGVLGPHLVGGRAVVAPLDPPVALRLAEEQSVTDLVLVWAAYLRLADHPGFSRFDLSSLQRILIAPMPPDAPERVRRDVGITPYGGFGMGEGLCLLVPPGFPPEHRARLIGRPVTPEDEIRLLDPETGRDVPFGQVGEMACRGPYTIRGYFDAADHNARVFTSDGFYRSGDLMRAHTVNGETHYSFEGRIKDNINRGGEKIHAEEVEDALVTHPSVRLAAVVGVPDPVLGERVCACVSLRDGAPPPSLEELRCHTERAGLARFKWPERLEIVESFPLTAVGKISKRELRADLAARRAAEPRR
jgi:2,3-dihydroxybenzoate-AMP ligase